FEGFSTFKCKPLLNIHDVIVLPSCRGKGIVGRMLEQVEHLARDRGCCKLTLEVLEGNEAARQAYSKAGFRDYMLLPETGRAIFQHKLIG
ncbi:MAG: GNAT family N-acetyltransferase, partial [Sedimenticolaceae bacterium]|nr:GNAT family N-acetyltransferase [Sedimenticolaceae bacterium]